MDKVNRTILTFTEIGLVDVVETMGGPRRHDPDLIPHHHLLCMSCNDIINFRGIQYDQLPIPDQIQNKCAVYSKRVVFTGLCEKCSKSPKARETKREIERFNVL